MKDIDSSNGLDRDALVADLAAQVDHWNSRGSGFVMERITNFILVLTNFAHYVAARSSKRQSG